MTPPDASSEPSAAQTASSPRQRRLAIGVILAGAVTVGMGQTVVFAVLPPLARKIGLHDLQVLSIFMISATFWVSCGPLWGRLSDRDGRRPFILLGLSSFAVSTALFAATLKYGLAGALGGAALYALLLLTRSIYGLVGSAAPPAAQAYIADRTPPEKRTSGLAAYSAAFGLGAMAGPAFAGALAGLGPVAPLFAIAGLAVASVGAVFFCLNEKTAPRESTRAPSLSPFDGRIRAFLVYGFATAIAMAIPTQFTSFYVIDRLGVADGDALQVAGVALSTQAGASLFSQLAIVQRFNPRPLTLMRAGPLLMMVGHGVIALSTDLGPLAFGMMLSGLGAGLILPGYVGGASLAVGPNEQGSIAGLSNAASSSSFIIAPLVGYAIYAFEPQALFAATMITAAASAAFAFASKTIRGRPTPPRAGPEEAKPKDTA